MNEKQWLASKQPFAMHPRCRRGRKRDLRRERLFACACCRRLWPILTDPRSRAAVETAERYADGLVGKPDLVAARVAAGRAASEAAAPPRNGHYTPESAVECVAHVEPYDVFFACTARAYFVAGVYRLSTQKREQAEQAKLLRDIFGNPFRPVSFAPFWRTDTAVAIARQMYDSHDFSAMPILADALQDAGCDNDDVLAHCRDTSVTHVRGCWVCDLVLGKA